MWGDEAAPNTFSRTTSSRLLRTDQSSTLPADPIPRTSTEWVTVKVKRKIQSYSGPRAQIVAYRDFLAPRTAETLDKADCCCYDYELPAIEIVEQYIARVQRQEDLTRPNTRESCNTSRDSQGSPMAGRTAANRPRADLGESRTEMSTRGDPLVRVAEFTLYIDANNDGVREDVYLLLDLDTNRPSLRLRPKRVPRSPQAVARGAYQPHRRALVWSICRCRVLAASKDRRFDHQPLGFVQP